MLRRRGLWFSIWLASSGCGDGGTPSPDGTAGDTATVPDGTVADATDTSADGTETSVDAADTTGDTLADTVPDGTADVPSDTVPDGDTVGPGDVTAYQVRYEGPWEGEQALFGTEMPPEVSGVGRPGEMLGPQSIAVGPMGLLVLDPARDRIVELGIDASSASTWAQDAFFHGAQDLVVDPDGVPWAFGAACACVRRLDLDPPEETAVAPEALGYSLMADGDGYAYLGAADGAMRWTVHVRDLQMTIDDQRESGGEQDPPSSPMALGWGARLLAPSEAAIELVDAFGDATRVALPGPALNVELFQLAYSQTCDPSLVLVAKVLADGVLAHAMVRVDLDGAVLHEESAPSPDPFHEPFRSFALLKQGRLFQLRTDGGGYAIVEWNIGCP